MTRNERSKIYKVAVNALENGTLSLPELLLQIYPKMGITPEELSDDSPSGRKMHLKASLGEILAALVGRGLLIEENGRYTLKQTAPVTIKAVACESKILKLLSERAMTKREIRSKLEEIFGTRATATQRDDNILYSYIGQILKRLVNERVLTYSDNTYSISKKRAASIGNIREILELKTEFLDRLHSKGGEFFEHYFITLLSKYLTKHGKTVTESLVVGGSADGGIDGIVKTVDCLGFRETVMVQTKNRASFTSETDVRGFYGAVCAKMGSRGIFATSSDFHSTATSFLNSIDNCIGVNGNKLFDMATECLFGIKKRNGKLIIDEKIL